MWPISCGVRLKSGRHHRFVGSVPIARLVTSHLFFVGDKRDVRLVIAKRALYMCIPGEGALLYRYVPL